jgi:hypothetical protein
MVNAILRVILNHKDHGVFPYRTLGNGFYKLAEGGIIVRNVRSRRWRSGG